MHTKEQLITTAEAAQLLDIHPKTCARHAREGKLPAMRVGRRWRFSPTALTDPALALPTPREPRPLATDEQLATPAPASARIAPLAPGPSAPRPVPTGVLASRHRTRGRHTVQLEI